MQQQVININQQLAYLMSTGKWRNCQRKQFNVERGRPVDLQMFTNNKALSKYKQYLMKCKFTGNKTAGTVQL